MCLLCYHGGQVRVRSPVQENGCDTAATFSGSQVQGSPTTLHRNKVNCMRYVHKCMNDKNRIFIQEKMIPLQVVCMYLYMVEYHVGQVRVRAPLQQQGRDIQLDIMIECMLVQGGKTKLNHTNNQKRMSASQLVLIFMYICICIYNEGLPCQPGQGSLPDPVGDLQLQGDHDRLPSLAESILQRDTEIKQYLATLSDFNFSTSKNCIINILTSLNA